MKKLYSLLLTLAVLLPWATNAQVTIPYNEGFENMSSVTDLNNAGWEMLYQSHSGSFLAIETTANNVSAGSKALNIDSWDAGSSSDYVVVGLPIVNAAINTLQITFSYKVSTGIVYVGYLTDANDASTFVSLQPYPASSTYTTITKELYAAPANAARIAIRYDNFYRCYIDEVEVKAMPTCKTPQNFSAANLTNQGVTFNWERHAQGTENAWVLEYGTSSDFTDATSVNVSGNPTWPVSGLTPNTTYYARVKADCGADGESDPTVAISFKTLCDPITLSSTDWTENFDALTAGSNVLPDCWNYINTSTHNNNKFNPRVNSSSAYSGSNCLYFYSTYSGYSDYDPQPQYAILPMMADLTGKQITLQARGYNTSSTFKIGTMTDPSDPSTFVSITEETGLTTSYQEFTYPLSGTNVCVAIMIDAASNNRTPNAVYIDDIVINDAPLCAKPVGLSVAANGQDATFSWTSNATSFDVAYAMDPSADPNDAANYEGAVADATSYIKNNLTLNADHYFWVRANCGNDGNSEWAGPVSVHIGYCQPGPTSIDGGGISNITFGTSGSTLTVNDDLSMSSPYYFNHSTMIGTSFPDGTVDLSIEYETNYTYYTWVWVDWNNDFLFSEDELVYPSTSTIISGTLNISFNVPSTTALGDYRMRIQGADGPGKKDPCYTGTYSYLADYTLRVTEAPSCMAPAALSLSRSGDQITATWNGTATNYNIDINGTVTNNVTSPYVFTADLSTNYIVKVQANCGSETSQWTTPQSISTPSCWVGRTIEYALDDSYGDGWNGASITFFNGCEETTLTVTSLSNNGTLNVCADYFAFIWNSGNYDEECSFTFIEGGTILFSGYGDSYSDGETIYTFGTQTCPKPTALDYEMPEAHQVKLSWTESGTAQAWQICVNGDENNLINVTTTDVEISHTVISGTPTTFVVYTLTGLNPETDYTVKVRANCGASEFSCWSSAINFSTDIACPSPSNLVVGTPAPNQVALSWYTTGDETAWQLCVNDDENNPIDVVVSETGITITNFGGILTRIVDYTLDGLNAETSYSVKVRANCGSTDGTSEWSNLEYFNTAANCPVPVLAANDFSNIAGHSADVAWTGFAQNDSYVVNYRMAEHIYTKDGGLMETFNSLTTGNTIPEGWSNSEGTTTNESYRWWYNTSTSGTGATNGTSHDNSKCVRFDSFMNGSSLTNFLQTPSMNFPAGKTMKLSFWWKNPNGGDLSVYISTDGGSTKTAIAENLAGQSAWKNETIELTDYIGASNVTIHFKGTSNYGSNDAYIYLDDVVVGYDVPAGSWQIQNVTAPTTSTTLTGLDPETPYEVFVTGYCTTGDITTSPSETQTFTTTAACPDPTTLQFVSAALTTATIRWTSPLNAWVVAYKAEGDDQYTEVNVTTNPFTIPNLTAATNYTVKVKADCSANNDGESGWSNEISFHTECPAYYPLPYTCDFETANTTGANIMPLCWTRMGTTTNYPYVVNNSSNAHEGTRSLYFYNSSYASYANEIAALPAIDADLNTVHVSFYGKLSSTSTDGSINVGYVTDLDDATTFTQVQTVTLTSTYEKYTVSFNNVGSVDGNIAFQALYNTDVVTIYIDDITVEALSNCLEPTGMYTSVTGTDNTTVRWKAGGEETTWNLQYRVQGENNWIPASMQAQGDSSFVFDQLTPNTTYEWQVQAVCGNNTSEWSATATFKTSCAPVATYSENFDNMTAGVMPDCWTKVGDNHAQVQGGETTAYPHSGHYCFYIYNGINDNRTSIVLTPELTEEINTKQINLYVTPAGGYGDGYGNLYVGYMTDASNANSFVAVKTLKATEITDWEQVIVPMSSAPNGAVMALKVVAGGGSTNVEKGWYIDDVIIEPIPAVCAAPTALRTVTVGTDNASVRWKAGGEETNWHIQYHAQGENQWSTVSLQGDSSNTFYQLTPGTTYEWQVRAVCGANFVSDWSATGTFTTTALYTVTAESVSDFFGSVNGTAYVEFTEPAGTEITLTAIPAPGYEFTRWVKYPDTEMSTDAVYTFAVSEDARLIAYFAPKVYNISYELNQGSWVTNYFAPGTYTYSEGVTLPTAANVEYLNHTFEGWYDNAQFTGDAITAISNTDMGDTTLYAKWTPNKYTITYMDGNTTLHIDTVAYGANVPAYANPEKECMAFAGWSATIPTVMPGNDIVVNAQWTDVYYNITATAEPANAGQVTMDPEAVVGTTVANSGYQCGTQVTLTATPNTGYSFVNWKEADTVVTTSATFAFEVKAARTFEAIFAANEYTITYMDGNTTLHTDTYVFGANVTPFADPTKECAEFTGWNETIPATMPANDIVLNAMWRDVYYNITVSADPTAGGTVTITPEPVVGTTEATSGYVCGTQVTLTATANTGYEFTNWTANGVVVSTAATFAFTATQDSNLVAHFTALQTVATPTIAPAAGEYAAPVDVTIACATEGASIYYTTDGSEPTENSTLYTQGFTLSQNTTVKAIAVKSGSNMMPSGVATAAYTFNFPTYTVTLNPGNGTVGQASLEGNAYTQPVYLANMPATPNTACADWTFAGWSTTEVMETTTAPTFVPEPYYPTANTTLYAVYQKTEQNTFNNTSGGDFTIFATVNSTNYYAQGTGSKLSSTTTESSATTYTFEKPTGYNNGEYAIKLGNVYLTYSSSTNLGTSSSPYKWTISAGTKGTWRITSQTTGRALVFRASNVNQFGGYATSNISTSGNEYYDIEIGGSSSTTYSSNPDCPYHITVNGNISNGTIAADKDEALEDETVTLTATPATGYHLGKWTVTKVNTPAVETVEVTNNTFTMPASDVYVSADFWIDTLIILATANPTQGGTVTGEDEYEYGTQVTVTATANSGYIFNNWTANGVEVSTDASFTFTATQDSDLIANFTAIQTVATPTFTPAAGSYTEPQTVTIACATEGASIYYTIDGSEPTVNATPYTAGIALNTNTTVKAIAVKDGAEWLPSEVATAAYTFNFPTYTVTLNPGSGTVGQTSMTGNEYTEPVYLANMPATPNTACTEWTFAGWSTTEVTETTTAPTFVADPYYPTADVTLYAVYQKTEQGSSATQSVTSSVTFSQLNYSNAQAISNVAIDNNVTATFAQGTNTNNAPKYYTSGAAIRCYGGNTITVASANTITGITLTFGSGDGSNEINTVGSYYETIQSLGIWTGSANSVEFTVGGTTGNRRIAGMSVTYSAAQPAVTTYNSNPICSYMVNVDANVQNGTISADKTEAVPGETVTLTATPATGYHFGKWEVTKANTPAVETVEVTNNTFTMPASDVNVSAIFWIDTLTITVSADPQAGGTVTGAGEYEYNTQVTLTATANTGYTFTGWTVNGQTVSADAQLTFNVTKDSAFVATFTTNEYTITYMDGNTQLHVETLAYGANVPAYADPEKECFEFIGWNETIPATMPANNVVLYAQWNDIYYNVTVSADPNNGGTATITPDPVTGTTQANSGYVCNTQVTLTATANEGYTFTGWTVNGQTVSTDAQLTFNVTKDSTFVATFTTNEYTITYMDGNTQLYVETLAYGANVPAYADPEKECFEFIGWNETIPATMPANNVVLYAQWNDIYYNVTVSADPNNGGTVTITPDPVNGTTAANSGYVCNTQVTLTATANEGYTFTGWTVNGQTVSTDAQLTFNVTRDSAFVATFTINTYTITATANPQAGGNVTGGGEVLYGAEVTLTATPAANYLFTNWTSGGQQVSTEATFTFTATQDSTFVANFSAMETVAMPTFDPVGGNFVDQVTVSINCTTPDVTIYYTLDGTDPVVPARRNVTGTQVYTDPITLTETTTIKAVAAKNDMINSQMATETYRVLPTRYVLGWNTVNGTVGYTPDHDTTGATIAVTATPAEGYHFAQWHVFDFNGNDVPVSNNEFIMPDTNVYVDAIFEPDTFDVTFVLNEGQFVNGYTPISRYWYQQQPALPTADDVKRDGYTFAGWYQNANLEGNSWTSIPDTAKHNLTYYAKWDVNSYDLTINYVDANGQTLAPAHTETLQYGAPYNVSTPDVATYMPDQTVVSGNMGTAAVTVDVIYTQIVMNTVDNQTVCAGGITTAVEFSLPAALTQTFPNMTVMYEKVIDITSIGIEDNGYGNIASFTAVNAGTEPVVATITVTPLCTLDNHAVRGVPQTFTITVNPKRTSEFSETVCDSYYWATADTTIVDEGTNDYVHVFTSQYGCDSTVTLHLTLYKTPTSMTKTVTPNTSCDETAPNGAITISAPTGDFQYSINGNDWQTTMEFAGLAAGNYTVYVRPFNSECAYTESVTLEDNIEMPVSTPSVSSTFYCLNSNITLDGSGSSTGADYTYAWTGPNNYSSSELSPVFEATDGNQSGTYVLTVTNTVTNCVAEASVDVVVNTPSTSDYLFTITAHGDAYANIDEGQTSVSPVFAAPVVNHYLNNTCTTVNDAAASYDAVGDYTITWTATDECGNIATTTQVLHVTQNVCPVATDVDNNTYPSVMLAGKCWMAKNLRTTQYSDNRPVSNLMVYDNIMYPNTTENLDRYGYLYDWASAMDAPNGTVTFDANNNVQGICPANWHLPTGEDFMSIAGNNTPTDMYDLRYNNYWLDGGGSNSTNYSLLPGGCYNENTGRYENILGNAYLWGVNTTNPSQPRVYWADCKCYMWQVNDTTGGMGYSVRCIKD